METHAPARWRVLIGLAILPFVQGLLAYLVLPLVLLGSRDSGLRWTTDVSDAWRMAVFTAGLGALVTLAGAMPVVVTLLRRGTPTLPRLLWVGVLLGNAPFAAWLLAFIVPATIGHLAMGTMSEHLVPVSSLAAGTLRVLLIGSGFGVVSAAVFWLVAIRPGEAGVTSTQPPA